MGVKPSTKPVATKLSLPTVANVPSDDLLDYFVMIFGRKNIGKSTFGSSYPDALTFMLERGRQNLAIMMVPKKGDKPLTFKSFREYFTMFCESDAYQVGVIDTIDALYNLIYQHFIAEYGGDMKEIQRSGNSFAFWDDVKPTFESFVAMAQDAGKKLVFISHEKAKDKPNADGTVLERIEPSCSGPALEIVQRYCDLVFHYDWVTNDRVLTLRSQDNAVWTSNGRNDRFLDPDGTPLNRIKIPNDPEMGFMTLESAFNGELRDYDYVAPKTTTKTKPSTPKKTGTAKK